MGAAIISELDLQATYEISGGAPHITVDSTNGPLTIRDNVVPIGDVFVLEDDAGVNFFDIDPAQINFGVATQRLFEANQILVGYGGITFYPDDFTRTIAGQSSFVWSSTLTTAMAGGGGIGNDTAPNFVSWQGELVLTDMGNLFNTQSLFNQATTITCEGADTGPIYTMLNQPTLRTGPAGGSRTGSQQNAVRSQPRVGPNVLGDFTLASHEAFFATCFVDATVGTAEITTVSYFAGKAPGLLAGGTIGTLNVLDIVNIPPSGITNLRGINSAMIGGEFIRHTGTAPSRFGGALQLSAGAGAADWQISHLVANIATLGAGDSLRIPATLFMGATGQVSLAEGAADRLDLMTGDSLRIVNGAVQWGSGGARILGSAALNEVQFDAQRIGFNTAPAGSNWQWAFGGAAQTTSLGGDFARRLFTVVGNITVNAALSNLFTDTINEPGITIGSGSVVNAGNVLIQTAPSEGTNRYGLLITSNPSGGTLNYCARFQGAAGVRIDGVFQHTGTTWGIFNTTPAVQPAAYTRNAVVVEDRTLLASASATTLNNNNVLAALITDLQSLGIIQ